MSSRRQKLLAWVNWYLQSSSKHIAEKITGNRFYYRSGRYRQVSLYFCICPDWVGARKTYFTIDSYSVSYFRCTLQLQVGHTQCVPQKTHTIRVILLTATGSFNPRSSWLCRWLSARQQYLQCVSNGDTAILHQAIDMYFTGAIVLLTRPLK